jgi:hypothetical protein
MEDCNYVPSFIEKPSGSKDKSIPFTVFFGGASVFPVAI